MYEHLMEEIVMFLTRIFLIGMVLLLCICVIYACLKYFKTYPIIINGSSYRVEKNVLNYIHKIEKETNKELERKF